MKTTAGIAGLLVSTAVVLVMGLAPAMAESSQQKAPPTESNVTPEASKAATVPQSGSADTSGGATEQSSSPPSAGSTMGKSVQGNAPIGDSTPNPAAPSSND